MRNRLECIVALLSREADPNLKDFEGNTALHMAAQQACLPIVQCLIVFGADLDSMNNNRQTARHLLSKKDEPKILYYLHAVGAKRCSMDMNQCTEGCVFNGTYDGVPPNPVIGPPNRDTLNQMLSVAGNLELFLSPAKVS